MNREYYFLTCLKAEIGEWVTVKGGMSRGITAITHRHKSSPGCFLYRGEMMGDKMIVREDLTPKHEPQGYEVNVSPSGLDDLIRTEDLGSYSIASDAFSRDRVHTPVRPDAEKLFALLKGVVEADKSYDAVMEKREGRDNPIYDTKDFAAQELEIRNRLINALADFLGV